MTNSEGDKLSNVRSEKKKLLDKYELTVDKLDFKYVEQCKNVRELEKICKVLRSGEEGTYPDLQKRAEDSLRKLSPNNRIFRVEEPILRREELPKSQRDEIEKEIESFKFEISSKDEQLQNTNSVVEEGLHPPIRRAKPKQKKLQPEEPKKPAKKPVMSDYSTWDKYDVDSEIIKMDLEEERKRALAEVEAKKEKAQPKLSAEDKRIQDVIKQSDLLSETEKSVLALREKDRGNEYYKVADFEEALRYYTASIAIHPNAVAYSNRAACYLKLSKFELALSDAQNSLRLDPLNTKALFRRGVCLQHKLSYDEALADFQTVLEREPHNIMVRHMADRLAQQAAEMPRKVRMLIEDENSDEKKLVEMSEEEAKKNNKKGYEVNEVGLAKSMCHCYGRPAFLNSPNTNAIAEHLLCAEDTSQKPLNINSTLVVSNTLNGNGNDKVVEIESNTMNGNAKVVEIEDEAANTILFKKPVETETGVVPPPLKIKIVETVGNEVSCNKKKTVVKDMRRSQNGNDADLNNRMSDMQVGDVSVGASNHRKVMNVNSHLNCSGDSNLNSEADVSTGAIRRPTSICVADKYQKKSSDTVMSPMTPHKYYTVCSTMRSASEFGRILRNTDPKQLDYLLSNKLDEQMLSNMVHALATEFDLQTESDTETVCDYLLSISKLQRVSFIAMLLEKETKQVLQNLINKVAGHNSTALLNSFSLN
ncbi:RNA polymerase II-associated protein 3 [Nilaparvata lugens]|uniref:RNA polymerase II-associated protein 3 n=1 Tax=Nilaparvata lugens TaxID=108931 RepID=UPI00193E3CA7|nr:RNA polymerase II-associated protein 3 [Nilaparvata lugens]XP_039290683.1 RNA polymerase II-associated protein 3 [Nilaparvata lugens]